jgi:hypothetical protein
MFRAPCLSQTGEYTDGGSQPVWHTKREDMHFVVLSFTLDDIVAIDGRFAPEAASRKFRPPDWPCTHVPVEEPSTSTAEIALPNKKFH